MPLLGLSNERSEFMGKNNTKQVILNESLKLFAIKGFDGVSVRDIAGKVGIKQSSLYKHFENKQAIFNSLLDYMSEYYEKKMSSLNVPLGELEDVAKQYENSGSEILYEICKAIFIESYSDEKEIQFRRMLTIEQFNNEDIQRAYKKFYIDDILEYQASLFEKMINHGFFISGDPKVMALHFYSPIYLLINKYDGDYNKENEVLDILKKHIEQFASMYVAP